MSEAICEQASPADDGNARVPEAVQVQVQWLDIPTTPLPRDNPYPSFGWDSWRAIYPY
ncbi:hypothetical protein LCGC14_2271630, partial [marine sediment metagenome]